MDFSPVSKYVISRRLYNERDFGQKYVKCYVRDPRNNSTLLDGAEMTEKTSQGDFEYPWTLPDDVYGNGRQLLIWSVVYEDSAYTNRDLNYSIEEHEVRVIDQKVGGGGFGGSSIDYKLVRKIVKEELAKLPPQNKLDLSSTNDLVKASQDAVLAGISAIEVSPEVKVTTEKADLKPVLNAIKNNKPAPPKPIDFSELKKMIKGIDVRGYNDEFRGLQKNYRQIIAWLENFVRIRPEVESAPIIKAIKKEFLTDKKDREGVEKAIFNIENKLNEEGY